MADSSQHGAGPGQGGHGPLELFRWLNRPCRDMTSLISAAMDERLPWPQRTAYRLHLLYCTACRRYRRQLLLLRTALQRICAQLVTP
ncbi:MAG: zf-HC2 domain-containing protein, partial [Planctomycetota bacterium]